MFRSMTQMHLVQVLPQIYGGQAAMVPIEEAVHARLVREGLERARSSADNQTAEEVEDAEGRLTRAGRYRPASLLPAPC